MVHIVRTQGVTGVEPWVRTDGGKVGIMSGISRVNEFIVPIDGVKVLIFVVATFMLDLSMVTAVVIIRKHCLK